MSINRRRHEEVTRAEWIVIVLDRALRDARKVSNSGKGNGGFECLVIATKAANISRRIVYGDEEYSDFIDRVTDLYQ